MTGHWLVPLLAASGEDEELPRWAPARAAPAPGARGAWARDAGCPAAGQPAGAAACSAAVAPALLRRCRWLEGIQGLHNDHLRDAGDSLLLAYQQGTYSKVRAGGGACRVAVWMN